MSKPTFDPNQPFRDGMRAMIGERWEAVWKAVPAAIDGSDIEGVHDVRVASRRLRAAMDISQEAFPASWYKPLHRAAKEITSELGEVRDRDVQIEYLEELIERSSPGDRTGIQRLIDQTRPGANGCPIRNGAVPAEPGNTWARSGDSSPFSDRSAN